MLRALEALRRRDIQGAKQLFASDASLKKYEITVLYIELTMATPDDDVYDPAWPAEWRKSPAEERRDSVRQQTEMLRLELMNDIANLKPPPWEEVRAKYCQQIQRDLIDSAIMDVRIHTTYTDYAHADRVLGEIAQDAAASLIPTYEALREDNGIQRYHVIHEGRLSGLQVKQYVTTVVVRGGEVWEVLS